MNDNNIQADDRFSLRRVISVGRFYWPRIRMQVILYSLASIVISALMVAGSYLDSTPLPMLAEWISMLMIVFAPVVFARYGSRDIDISLPVNVAEHACFILLYLFVAVPLLVLLIPGVMNLIFSVESVYSVMAARYSLRLPDIICWLSASQICIWCLSLLPTGISLLMTMTFRRNVVFRTIVWSLVIGFVYMLGMMVASAVAISRGLIATFGDNMDKATDAQVYAAVDAAVSGYLEAYCTWGFGVITLLGLGMIAVNYKIIKNRHI